MFDWIEYATRMKHNEFKRNAEEWQLIEEALAARENADPYYYKALAALGRRLTAWGGQLQERYDHARQMPLEPLPLEPAHE
jgi:hypothetical protein